MRIIYDIEKNAQQRQRELLMASYRQETSTKGYEVVAEERFPADRMLTTEEVGKYLRLSEKAVREAAARGDLVGHKMPAGSRRGTWRFWKSEVDESLRKKPRQYKRKGASIWS